MDGLHAPAILLVLSGPSGIGKSTLCDRLVRDFAPQVRRVITATTRPPRQGEQDKVDYYFLPKEEFEERREAEAFYEWAQVHGRHYYGTPKFEIREKLAHKHDLVMNLDVQGAMSFRKAARRDELLRERLVTIFVRPQAVESLRERLRDRGTDDPKEIERRLRTAEVELEYARHYDYAFVSGTKEEDFERLRTIYHAEKMRVRPQSEH